MKNNSYFGRGVLAALLLFSLFITSCGPKLEYREDTIRPVTYEIITEKGLKRWGLVNYMDGRVIERYLEPVYDSIYHSQDIKYLFFALKNGNVYAYNEYEDGMLFDETPVNKIINSDDLYEKYSNSTGGNLYNVANTDKGNYYFRNLDHSSKEDFCFGPYENFFKGFSGYAYKENGKWGVKMKKVLKGIGSNSSETKYIPFLPAKYEAAIEVACPNDYWLVKENGVWKAFTIVNGQEIKKSERVLKLLLGLPILDWRKFDSNHYPGTDIGYYYRRIGGPEYGTINVRDRYTTEGYGY